MAGTRVILPDPPVDEWLRLDSDPPVTFGAAGAAFLQFRAVKKSPRTMKKHTWLLGVLRPLWDQPLGGITAPELLRVLRRLESTGKNETAARAGMFTAAVFRYAIGEGWCTNNPARDLRGNLEGVVVQHHPAIVDPIEFGSLMLLVDQPGYSHRTVYNALRLIARTALRPGELRHVLWSDVDRGKAEIVIPAERMKMRRPHLVPLSTQTIEILEDQWQESGEAQSFVFPGVRPGRPMSDAGMNVALRNMFITQAEHVPHGFRSSFSTLMNERGEDAALIELQLSHRKRDRIAGIYDRSERVPDRRVLMQKWADYIDELKTQARNLAKAAK
ncbi:MAG TPA: site-specific integrase [Steroidobacteraceae bacterium]|nr:site-specific integrase [Steroidobacteraceae bacterium]